MYLVHLESLDTLLSEGDIGNQDNHASDISEAEDEPEVKTVDHSDISDDENPVLERPIKADSSDEEDQDNTKPKRPQSSSSDSEDEGPQLNKADSTDDENVPKKPTLASTVVRPPPPSHQQVLESQVRKKKSKSYDYATKLVKLAIDVLLFIF